MQLRAKPWITKGLKAAIAIKNKLYKSYLKFKNDYYFSKYKPYRNNLKHLVISPNESTASPKARRTSQRGLLELRLQNESQELEIKKLELQLQLVQLQTSHPTTTSRSDPAAKSLDDLKAPQRTVSPQQWPHIFARGEPKLYNDLLLPEFSTGFLVIVQRCEDPTLQTTLLAHFHDLMVLACNYKWSAVLAFHYMARPSTISCTQVLPTVAVTFSHPSTASLTFPARAYPSPHLYARQASNSFRSKRLHTPFARLLQPQHPRMDTPSP